jgi:glyoxylase-like metal-dependent hydrolase (beta-lactamase superfamily II)
VAAWADRLSKEAPVQFRFWKFDEGYAGPESHSDAEAAEIAPGLWYVGSYHCCAYLLHTDAGAVVIDTCDRRAADFFVSQIRSAGVDPASVVAVLHTHGHADHTGNTAELVRLSGAQAMIGAGDAPWLAEQTAVDRMLCPGETVTFGETEIAFFSAPGHTLGCGMYLAKLGQQRLCFMGDSCGPYIFRTSRWTGDREALQASAERMKTVEADIFLPGHPDQILEVSPEGDPRLSREQWHRYIDQRLRAMEQIISEVGE